MSEEVPVIEVQFMYGRDGYVMADDLYVERDADMAVAFTIDGCVLVGVDRAPGGKWRINMADGAPNLPVSAYRYRFSTLNDAVDYVATKCGIAIRRVESWV